MRSFLATQERLLRQIFHHVLPHVRIILGPIVTDGDLERRFLGHDNAVYTVPITVTQACYTLLSVISEILDYQKIFSLASASSEERYTQLRELHPKILDQYTQALRAMTDEEMLQSAPNEDFRDRRLVIGHIAGWERFQLVALGEIMAGVLKPSIMNLSGFKLPDGSEHSFRNVDDVNAFFERQQRSLPPAQIRNEAVYSATAICELFTSPTLLPLERRARTEPYQWKSLARKIETPVESAPVLPCVDYLQLVSLEHYLEHEDVLFPSPHR